MSKYYVLHDSDIAPAPDALFPNPVVEADSAPSARRLMRKRIKRTEVRVRIKVVASAPAAKTIRRKQPA
jgi:hypothetical protein